MNESIQYQSFPCWTECYPFQTHVTPLKKITNLFVLLFQCQSGFTYLSLVPKDRKKDRKNERKKEEWKSTNSLNINTFKNHYSTLNECDNIRKILKTNCMGMSPSRAANGWKLKGPYNIKYYIKDLLQLSRTSLIILTNCIIWFSA